MDDQWQQLSVQWRQWSEQWRSNHTQQLMVATDVRTMVATDGLINGGNGEIIQSKHTMQVVGAIIQSNQWPINGGN